MKAVLIVVLIALCAFAYAQPPKPVWVNAFSATVSGHRTGEPHPHFFRWFYDFRANKDRFDGVVRWHDEPWFTEVIYDHSKKVEYAIFREPATIVCITNTLNRTIPRPNFQNVVYFGTAIVNYVPAYVWYENDTARRISFFVYDDQVTRRVLRMDVDDRDRHVSESWTFLEFDAGPQDPNLFVVPANILAQCTAPPTVKH